jgi:hypothetical protein
MKNTLNKIFSMDTYLSWMRTYRAPFIGMIIFTAGVVFQSEQFFIDSYPDQMPDSFKLTASFFLALSLEFLIILVTVNYQHDNDFAINFFFFLYLIITLYFLETFNLNKNIGYYLIRSFSALIIAFMARTYADLLIQKLKEHFENKSIANKIPIDYRQEILDLKQDNIRLRKTIEKKIQELNSIKTQSKNKIGTQIPITYARN